MRICPVAHSGGDHPGRRRRRRRDRLAALGLLSWKIPWTRDGRVRADVVQVAPDVAGIVTEVRCARQPDGWPRAIVLFRIDHDRYRLALAQADAAVANRAGRARPGQPRRRALPPPGRDRDLRRPSASRRNRWPQQAIAALQQSPGRSRPGAAQPGPHRDPRARQRHRHQPRAAGRRLRRRRPSVVAVVDTDRSTSTAISRRPSWTGSSSATRSPST